MNYASPYTPSYAAYAPYPQQYPSAAMISPWTGQVVAPNGGVVVTPPIVAQPVAMPTGNASPLTGAFWQDTTLGIPRWALGLGGLSLLGIGLAWQRGMFGSPPRARQQTSSTSSSRSSGRRTARDPQPSSGSSRSGSSRRRSAGRSAGRSGGTSGSSGGGNANGLAHLFGNVGNSGGTRSASANRDPQRGKARTRKGSRTRKGRASGRRRSAGK